MMLSDLIERLQELQADVGDATVFIRDDMYDSELDDTAFEVDQSGRFTTPIVWLSGDDSAVAKAGKDFVRKLEIGG